MYTCVLCCVLCVSGSKLQNGVVSNDPLIIFKCWFKIQLKLKFKGYKILTIYAELYYHTFYNFKINNNYIIKPLSNNKIIIITKQPDLI